AALIFGSLFFSCGGGDDDPDPTPTSGTIPDRRLPSAPAESGTITVSGGGASYSGTSIEEAWAAAAAASGDVVITIPAGTYTVSDENQLKHSGSANITIKGTGTAEYGLDVLIKGNPNTNSQKSRELLYLDNQSTGSLMLENIALENKYGENQGNAQAEVLASDGKGNIAAYNCSFLSHQDTIRTVAKAWFYECYIEGDVDFLWMDTAGTAALYEKCVLRAVGGRTNKAYFTAPRAALTTKVGKGLVIYNSNLEAESTLSNVYLGRNPWATSALTSYYNQVAVVNSEYCGVALNADIWASAANGTADQQYVGFKTDTKFNASSKYGARLSEDVKNKEYSGRKAILNRVYNTASGKFSKDAETYWDIDAVITANKWDVDADASSDLLAGESEPQITVYDFAQADGLSATGLTINGFKSHDSGSATGSNGNTIKFNADGNCIIYVSGCYSGYGTIKAGEQGEAVYDFNSDSTDKILEKAYINYSGAAEITITAADTSYIKKIVVEYDNTLVNVPVTAITVTADTNKYTVGAPVQLKAAVTPDNASNKDVKWTSSDLSVGEVNEMTGKVTFKAAGTVTFTATARDGSGKTGTIACTPEAATWTSAEWYNSKDTSSSAGGGGTSFGDHAGANNSAFTIGGSGVTLGGNKEVTLIDGTKKNISTGIKMDSSGKITFTVTKNAKAMVLAGYYTAEKATTTDNVTIKSSDGTATASSENPAEAPTADAAYVWTLTAGTYTLERAASGYALSIYYVRVDITE
ncbi:MAG: Ig-like domain-containing protein, partial [Bacteroides sp.]|nr:Ig-like domain-containing protein [Prevotella sp.]MCM1470723.1 Ig-like domain-containing protein [Bacteroides sp.]